MDEPKEAKPQPLSKPAPPYEPKGRYDDAFTSKEKEPVPDPAKKTPSDLQK